MTIEKRQLIVSASPETIYKIFSGLGGKRGWLYMNWAWQIRGLIDRIAGGVGMRRGRRDPENVRIGDALDFWRVEEVEYNSLLRLRAEMKVPGKAWLQFSVTQHLKDKSLLTQTAFLLPKDWLGGFIGMRSILSIA
jgi:hypothetical protein